MQSHKIKTQHPIIIAVAPNGARKNKHDHPKLPITAGELADCAAACRDEGATMIHLHVRDQRSLHSLSPVRYKKALSAVKSAVGDQMMIQITSEAAGIYQSETQIELMMELTPDFISIALREYLGSDKSLEKFKEYVDYLHINQCVIQYILYDFEDYETYKLLIKEEIIPTLGHSILMVLGRYSSQIPEPSIVNQYKKLLQRDQGCMVCTFGANGHQILTQAANLGCHLRVGFENGFLLPNGDLAMDNAQLVAKTIESIKASGKTIANIDYTRNFFC